MQQKPPKAEDYSIEYLDSLILSIKRKTGLNEEEIAKSLKYNEGYISQTRSRGKASEKFIQALQSLLNAGLQNANEVQEPETAYPEKSLNNLTESNKVLAEANKTLAEANKTLAEANHVISKNHDELIQLTKMIVNFSNTPKEVEERLHSGKQEGAHPALGDLALDKKYSRDKKIVKDR